jgi:hypothetical protein
MNWLLKMLRACNKSIVIKEEALPAHYEIDYNSSDKNLLKMASM